MSTKSSANESVPASATKHRKSMQDDRLVRGMTLGAFALVILFLVTIVSAFLMGVLGSDAPQTKYQRDIALYEQTLAKSPKDPSVWHQYITLLIADKQYRKAQDTIDLARKAVDDSTTQDLATAQAELFFATNKNDEAIKAADALRTKLKKTHEAAKLKADTPESLGEGFNENYWSALVLKAEAYAKLDRLPDAVKSLDEYLKESPRASDVLTRRGELKLLNDDKKGAEADFRTALKYIPDYDAALAGLKKIGAK